MKQFIEKEPHQTHLNLPLLNDSETQTTQNQTKKYKLTPDWKLMEEWVKAKSSPRTKKAYLTLGEELLKKAYPRSLKDLDFSFLHYFISYGMEGRSEYTKKLRLSIVKSLFVFAVKSRYILYNPTVLFESVKTHSKVNSSYLSEEQVFKMIDVMKEKKSNDILRRTTSHFIPLRNELIVRILYVGGFRLSELLGMKWEHVQARVGGLCQITVRGKGNKDRTLIFKENIYTLLMELKPKNAKETDFIFINEFGKPLSKNGVSRIVEYAALLAGVPKKISPHDLRHNHATHALARGASVDLLQRSMGHKDIRTLFIYIHSRPDDSSSMYLGV